MVRPEAGHLVSVAYTVADGLQLWAKRHDSGGYDFGKAVDVTRDGRTVFVTGESVIPGLDKTSHLTIAYDAATGQRLASTGIGPGVPRATTLDPDGTALYVTGYVFPFPGPMSFGTVAYSVTP